MVKIFGEISSTTQTTYVQEVVTHLYRNLIYKMGNYFLDIPYCLQGFKFIDQAHIYNCIVNVEFIG